MTAKPSNTVGGGAAKAADPRTLFVKFHPPSASITRQHLADHFSEYGPVNRCSVIRQSKTKRSKEGDEGDGEVNYDRGSKGYGFVRFVHEDDARDAAAAIKKKSGKRGGGEVMVVEGIRYKLHAERAVDATSAAAGHKKERGGAKREKKDAAKGDVQQSAPSSDAAYKAEAKRKRTSRVIVRNLSFYATDKHVQAAMEENFGPVAAVDLPLVPALPGDRGQKKKSVPRHRGFAFVTFTNANAAKQAVERGSETKIKNRVVAIDFSVSKAEHKKMQEEEERSKKEENESESESDSESEDKDQEENEEKGSGNSGSDSESDGSDSESDSDEESSDEEEDEEASQATKDSTTKEAPQFDETEANRTLFLRNIPFDATRHDVFDLFRQFGRIEAVYLVKDKRTGVFKGTAFVRFANDGGCAAAMEASGEGSDEGSQFVSSKNLAMGVGGEGGSGGLTLKGRHIFVDAAVDRTTASSLAVQRDADGKPIKKMVGKDKRNLYLKNEGRVASAADTGDAQSASATFGGRWEDLPPGDRAKRERAFADKSTKLRSPLFFISPTRLAIRNLAKHVGESELKQLVFGALKTGLEHKLATPKDAVSHWRAGGELPHSEVMRRATDPTLVTPPIDEKNLKESVPSVFIDRDTSGGRKTADAPSRGFGFVEFAHHAHALAVLRQLNNNPLYSAEYAAGGKHASEMAKRGKGKKGRKAKADPETGAEFMSEDGRVCVPRLIVEFAVENKVKARQQAEKIAQKKANKIKQRIENKEKQQPKDKKKEKKKGRGALQREKKRARKEAGDDDKNAQSGDAAESKKQKLEEKDPATEKPREKKQKMVKPPKKRKIDREEDTLEGMIGSYKSTFLGASGKALAEEGDSKAPKKNSREEVAKKRWFE
ncbi:hypothetical protein ACHAXT_001166 [Thalassiosira profunda]